MALIKDRIKQAHESQQQADESMTRTSRNDLRRKEKKIIQTYEEPMLPNMCKIIFACMLIVMAAMLLVECKNFYVYRADLGVLRFFHNISTTGFVGFLVSAAILIPLSLVGSRQAAKRYWQQQEKSGIKYETEEDRARGLRAINRINKPFHQYELVCIILVAVFGILYLISALIS